MRKKLEELEAAMAREREVVEKEQEDAQDIISQNVELCEMLKTIEDALR